MGMPVDEEESGEEGAEVISKGPKGPEFHQVTVRTSDGIEVTEEVEVDPETGPVYLNLDGTKASFRSSKILHPMRTPQAGPTAKADQPLFKKKWKEMGITERKILIDTVGR